MEALSQTHAVDVHWRSFELRPKNSPPIPPEYRARIEAGRPQLYQIARERYGLELNPGPFGVDSRPALIGAKVAESHGCAPAYHAAIMAGYWQEARKIDDVETLASLAEQAGMERAEFLAGLADPLFADQVDMDIAQAQMFGLNSVPAIVFAEKYLVSGAQPVEVLRRVAEQVMAEEG